MNLAAHTYWIIHLERRAVIIKYQMNVRNLKENFKRLKTPYSILNIERSLQMRRTLLVLLTLVLVLTACGTTTTEVVKPTQATTVQTEAVAAPSEVTAAKPTIPVQTEEVVAPTEVSVEPAQSKKLVIGFGSEDYPMLGWIIDGDDAFSMAYIGILETLVKIDFDGLMVPSLAESWTQVDDTTWQFNLRKDVTFQNGEPFNAAAVVNALNYIKNSPTPPRGITADTFTSIEAKDDYTVIIKTASFDALVPNRLTSPNTGILAPSAYTAASGPINPFGTGTGPFTLSKEVPEQSLTLVKNPNYWDGKVNLDEVEVLFVPDATVRAGMLQTGEIDIDIHVPVEQIPVLSEDPDLTIFKVETPRTTTLHLNMSRAPFNDLKVRQAVAYAIDKESIVIATLEGAGSAAIGPMAPTEGWANAELTGYPYDPEKAKQLLAEAGYAEGELTVGLWTYPTRANLPTTAVAIQDMLSQVGINVEIRIAQYDPMAPDVLAGNYDMFIISRSHVTDNYDPEGFFTSDYSCTGSFNMDLFCDQNFDTLLAQARTMTDANSRYGIYRELQSILVDQQCVGVFLNYTAFVDGIRNNVVNFKAHPLERIIVTADLDIAP
jgi:peptide/nickel transport system substrate-binding protein